MHQGSGCVHRWWRQGKAGLRGSTRKICGHEVRVTQVPEDGQVDTERLLAFDDFPE
jgi:hypothetical protein